MTGNGRDYTICGLILPIYLPTFIFAVSEGIAIPVVPLMVYQVFGSTETMVGSCVAVVGLGKIASNLPSGRFIAKHGNRRAMLVAQLSLLGSTTAAAVSPSVFLLLVSQAARGAGFSLWTVARQALIAANVRTERRGRAMSLVGGMSRLAKFVGPIAGGSIAKHVSVRGALWVACAFQALALCVVWASVPSDRRVDTSRDEGPGKGEGEGENENRLGNEGEGEQVVTNGKQCSPKSRDSGARSNGSTGDEDAEREATWGQIFAAHRNDLCIFGVFTLGLMVLRDSRNVLLPLQALAPGGLHLEADELGHVLAASYFADAATFPFAGCIMDRCGRKAAAVPSAALQGLAFLLMPFTVDVGTLTAVGVLTGLGNGISSGLLMTIGSDLAPAATRAQFLGLYRTFSDTGSLLGPLLAGAIADSSLNNAACFTGGIGLVVAMWLACVARETHAQAVGCIGYCRATLSGASTSTSTQHGGGKRKRGVVSANVWRRQGRGVGGAAQRTYARVGHSETDASGMEMDAADVPVSHTRTSDNPMHAVSDAAGVAV